MITRNSKGRFERKAKRGQGILPMDVVINIIQLFYSGKKIREIAAQIKFYDSTNKERRVSKTAVHKILSGIYS